MIRSLAALVGSTCVMATPALADDPLACLDPAVADTLLAKPNEGQYMVTREWPEHFPNIEIPREFTLIGSRIGQRHSVIAFKTSLSAIEAIALLETVGKRAGWERPRMSSFSQQGFQLPRSRADASSTGLCKPSIGNVAAEAFPATDGATYVTVTGARHATSTECDPLREPSVPRVDLPVLHLPTGSRGSATGAFPESENQISSRAHLETTEAAAAVVDHFAEQLSSQSWRRVAQWVHETVHGSAWISADARASALLIVLERGDGRYDLTFAALPTE